MTNSSQLVLIHVPIQINQGVVFWRDGMTITHEEADTIIIRPSGFRLCGQRPSCCLSLSYARQKIWSQQVSWYSGAATKLQCLLNEAFIRRYRAQSGNKNEFTGAREWTSNGGSTYQKLLRKLCTVPLIDYDSIHSTAHPSKNDASNYERFPVIITLKLLIRTVFVLATFMASL